MLGGRLWGHFDFLKLWSARTVSELGTQVSLLALPTIAILILHANPVQVGLLAALERLPFPVLGLFAGVWADRIRRKPLMIITDAGRGLALLSIPVAALMGVLTLNQLYVVALVVGCLTTFFDVAALAFLPSLVGQQDLVEGNTKFEFSFSLSNLLGPGLGGLFIQLLGAAKAILADVVSYLVSVVMLIWIRKPEEHLESLQPRRAMRVEIGEGLSLVFRNPVLRALLINLTILVFGSHMAEPVEYVFAYNQLHISPGLLGLFLSVSGVGSIIGVLISAWFVRTFGLGPTIVISGFLATIWLFILPLAAVVNPAFAFIPAYLLLGIFDPVHNINQVSLRMGLTPRQLQGRMNATFRVVFWGAWPVSNLLGGYLASTIKPIPTFFVAGAIATFGSLVIVFTPLGRLRHHPNSGTT